jgi:MarR family transcriptional regulator, organic hydroperoxide resistance regulator
MPPSDARRRPQPSGQTLQFMQRLWEVVHALEVRSKRMKRELGITGPQRLVLRIVGQSPGASPRDIASTLGIHPSTLTGVLARLVAAGHLVREPDPEDGRRALFDLTASGRRIDRERRGTVEAAVRRALARASSNEIAHTATMLSHIIAELERAD